MSLWIVIFLLENVSIIKDSGSPFSNACLWIEEKALSWPKIRELNNNMIHGLCNSAIIKKEINIKNGDVQRTFIPSKIFVNIINKTIQKKIFNNSIMNITYKNYNLKNIALIIKKRFKLIFNLNIKIKIENFNDKKKYSVYTNKKYKFKFFEKKIYDEIDQVLKNIK